MYPLLESGKEFKFINIKKKMFISKQKQFFILRNLKTILLDSFMLRKLYFANLIGKH